VLFADRSPLLDLLSCTMFAMISALSLVMLVGVASAATSPPPPPRPNIPNDFTSEVELREVHDHHELAFNGMLYESYSTLRERIDVDTVRDHPVHVEMLRLFNVKNEYEITGVAKHCLKRQLNTTMEPAFTWVRMANYSSTGCEFKFEKNAPGSLWVVHSTEVVAELCVSQQDPNTPFWVSVHHPGRGNEGRQIQFRTFIPGAPSTGTFQVPTTCPSSSSGFPKKTL